MQLSLAGIRKRQSGVTKPFCYSTCAAFECARQLQAPALFLGETSDNAQTWISKVAISPHLNRVVRPFPW